MNGNEILELNRLPHDVQVRLLSRWQHRQEVDYNSSDWSADSLYSFEADRELDDIVSNRRLDYVIRHANEILINNGHQIFLEIQEGMPIPRSLLINPDENAWRENH